MPSEHRTTTRSGSAKQAIARGVVALFKEHIGRGPTTSRAYINDDLVTVLLRETLTDVERTLRDHGEKGTVLDMRHSFSQALCEDAVALVEAETGQRVTAFVDGHSVDNDCAVMCFVLGREAQ
jgi:uncharacterized protein YbcI